MAMKSIKKMLKPNDWNPAVAGCSLTISGIAVIMTGITTKCLSLLIKGDRAYYVMSLIFMIVGVLLIILGAGCFATAFKSVFRRRKR